MRKLKIVAALIGVMIGIAAGAAIKIEHPWIVEKTYIKNGLKVVETHSKFVAKGYRPRMKPGREPEGRFEPYNDYLDKWIIVRTNDVVKPYTQPSKSRFQAKIDEMEPGYQKQKKIDQAAKKFGKNIAKVRKDFEKYIEKSATDEEREFWQSLLDCLPVPN